MHRIMQGLSLITTAAALILAASQAVAEPKLEVEMYEAGVEGRGDSIGTVTLTAYDQGVLIESDLTGLSPGVHGFHLHENADCSPVEKDGKTTPAGAAGGHYDPENTGKHKGPFDKSGHLGDLPRLHVGQEGNNAQTNIAPRLQLSDFKGRALVIHGGGDNYSDSPQPLGGGGARVACGVVAG
ncbi:Cu-Zn family superoxide dismutase [Marinobacter nauticus]|uniref:Superoxide dismutase [Cu-Zn] n=1 Tax=Marinobacter nauticus TaxID=2743 RepID=A0A368XVD3_MARNT|nr:superoxide dismutase family protein [Marinobacter nauticus]RCW71106.1 Cu-Zn family superoxide dismutase [Marinobacter nauticus]